MLDLSTLPILDTPVKQMIEGEENPVYVGIGRRYEAGLKSLTARAELELEIGSAEWRGLDNSWIGDRAILVFWVCLGDYPEFFNLEGLEQPTPCRSSTRRVRADFATGLKLTEEGRITTPTPEELDALGFEGVMMVGSRNPDRIGDDPATRFWLDGAAIHALTSRILPEIAMYAITNRENWAGSGVTPNSDHLIPDPA